MKYTLPLILATALCLSACGNKGPLVMPQKPVPVETSTAAPAVPAMPPEATPTEPAETPADTSTPATESTPTPDPK
ncbi:lipoprotein [Lysobacter sp. HDW10]|uniref:LPS translocon maturation chaperone LptM n=1 Tax=Lysobacter sp. HDW10 TaxID=2714936 RepID=UPI00140AA971|nr:lipoprotein [Lysobacter sp. HDW10]QIK81030.1 lipoprotein [Lysobacter sp. HDW10]